MRANTRVLARSWPYLAYLPPVLFLFSGVLFQARVPYLRDILSHYYPDYVFLARAAGQGVAWPLWNPFAHAGGPFLMSYPGDLVLVNLFGPLAALRLDAPLHVLLAMCGASALSRQRGIGPAGAWATGLFYGLSGFLLSSTNIQQIFHAAAWAPWVMLAILGVYHHPGARRSSVLGLVLALQVSTLAADFVLQTAFACLFLLPHRPSWRHLRDYACAAFLAVMLSAPTLLGTSALLADTRRAAGFAASEALARSATPLALLETVVPRLFGDVSGTSGQAYWGIPFYGDIYPYFMSLYLGPGVLVLALLAGLKRDAAALWLLALLGLLMSLGSNGPVAPLLLPFLRHFRFPVKFFFLANLALCLLAGQGIDRCARERPSVLRFVPASIFLLAALIVPQWPRLAMLFLQGLAAQPLQPQVATIVSAAWPAPFLSTGALCLAACLALGLGPRWGWTTALLVGLDLLGANVVLNRTAPPDFYALSPSLRPLVERASASGPFRWLNFSVDSLPGVEVSGGFVSNQVWDFYVARQSMLGTSGTLDGIESAFEAEDSFAPESSTLSLKLRRPERLREFFPHVRLANVRWMLSLAPLPDELVALAGVAPLPGLQDPLRFYEVRAPVPRAFWTPRCEVVADRLGMWLRTLDNEFDPQQAVLLEALPPGLSCDGHRAPEPLPVSFERPDPHTVRLRVRSPPGFIVVVEGFHRDWHASGAAGPVPLLRAYGRYWALPTPGGEQSFVVRFAPGWRVPALVLAGLGVALFALAFQAGQPREAEASGSDMVSQ